MVPRAAVGARLLLRLGRGVLRIGAAGEVVRVLDQPWRQGFAYGTLESHPERGEELFCLELCDDDTVVLTVTAFWRPAAAPVTRRVQERMTRRYFCAL